MLARHAARAARASAPRRALAASAPLLARSRQSRPDRLDVPPRNLGIMIVPQQTAYVVERWGKFDKTLEPGLNFLVPIMQRVAYTHSLKVQMQEVTNEREIFTKDNVHLEMDGVLYYQIYDPKRASYNVDDVKFAIKQLAISTMRSEIGKLTLDETLRERTELNHRIVEEINDAVEDFGVRCLRYEIREIHPPDSVVESMELEVTAERRKRQQVIDSLAEKEAAINVAEGEKQALVLASEAQAAETINLRRGEAEGVKLLAEAQANATKIIAEALQRENGADAAALTVAKQYVDAFGKLAHRSNTMLLPSNAGDPASMVAQAMSIFKTVANKGGNNSSGADANAAIDAKSSPRK